MRRLRSSACLIVRYPAFSSSASLTRCCPAIKELVQDAEFKCDEGGIVSDGSFLYLYDCSLTLDPI